MPRPTYAEISQNTEMEVLQAGQTIAIEKMRPVDRKQVCVGLVLRALNVLASSQLSKGVVMYTHIIIATCAIFLALTSACTGGPTSVEMLYAAEVIDRQLAATINNKDLDGLAFLYWNSPDLLVLDDSAFTYGLSAWKTEMKEWFHERPRLRMEFIENHNKVAGEIVLGWRKWKSWDDSQSGARKTIEGLYSDVKAFRNGKWVIVSQTFVKLAR